MDQQGYPPWVALWSGALAPHFGISGSILSEWVAPPPRNIQMGELFCKISDARAKNPVKVIGLTALISGCLAMTGPIAIWTHDAINWSGYEIEDFVGICAIVLSTIGIFGGVAVVAMLFAQLGDMSYAKEDAARRGNNASSTKTYNNSSGGTGNLNEYERGAMESQMYNDSFMIAHGQNPYSFEDRMDHTFDPFGFGDD